MSIVKKISLIFLVVLMLNLMFNMYISNGSYNSKMGTLITATEGQTPDNNDAETKVTNIVQVIITIIRIVGVCVAIVMILVVAMKYMTAAAGEKAEIKKSAVQYVVGAVVLFGAVGILTIIDKFALNIK